MIKKTRLTARGYTKPSFACADCGRVTKAVQRVWGVGRDASGARNVTLVCRAGSGCHKETSPNRAWTPA